MEWVLRDDVAYPFSYSSARERLFRLEPIFPPNVRPYLANAKRFELQEEWASFENPDYLVKGKEWCQVGRDKVARIASFRTHGEGKFVLALLVTVLNAPADSLLCREISQSLMNAFSLFPDELDKIDAQEAKEAEERAAKLEAERIQQEIERAKKELLRKEAQAKKEKRARLREQLRGGVHVYVFQLSNDTVKIGITNNIPQRIRTIQGHSGLVVAPWASTDGLSEADARQIERRCHEHFKEFRTHGEFFTISFDEACVFLQSQVAKPLTICREEFK